MSQQKKGHRRARSAPVIPQLFSDPSFELFDFNVDNLDVDLGGPAGGDYGDLPPLTFPLASDPSISNLPSNHLDSMELGGGLGGAPTHKRPIMGVTGSMQMDEALTRQGRSMADASKPLNADGEYSTSPDIHKRQRKGHRRSSSHSDANLLKTGATNIDWRTVAVQGVPNVNTNTVPLQPVMAPGPQQTFPHLTNNNSSSSSGAFADDYAALCEDLIDGIPIGEGASDDIDGLAIGASSNPTFFKTESEEARAIETAPMPTPLTAPMLATGMLATGNSLLAPGDKAPFFYSNAAANFSTNVMAETTEKARAFMFSQENGGISPVKVKPKAMPKKKKAPTVKVVKVASQASSVGGWGIDPETGSVVPVVQPAPVTSQAGEVDADGVPVPARGNYKCGRCGQYKVNHNCLYTLEMNEKHASVQTEGYSKIKCEGKVLVVGKWSCAKKVEVCRMATTAGAEGAAAANLPIAPAVPVTEPAGEQPF